MENINNVVNEEIKEDVKVEEAAAKEAEKNEKTFTQEELDKILNKKFAQWQKKTEEAKAEAERKAKLTEAEKLAEERKEFERMKMQFEYEQRVNSTSKTLASYNLPIEFSDFLVGENEEVTNKRIELFKDAFNSSLEKMVNERLKGNPPKVATSAKTGLSKDDFRKMNMAQRIKLRNENLALYNELSK